MEKRDETHVEQHGDGDVNVEPAPPNTGSPEGDRPPEGTDTPEQAQSEGQQDESDKS